MICITPSSSCRISLSPFFFPVFSVTHVLYFLIHSPQDFTSPMVLIRQIIPNYPGYSWVQCASYNDLELEWVPVKNVYSPPLLTPHIHCHRIPLTRQLIPIVGHIIGKDGCHFKWITHASSALYIYLHQGCIEIWTTDPSSLKTACDLMYRHIDRKMFYYGFQNVSSM